MQRRLASVGLQYACLIVLAAAGIWQASQHSLGQRRAATKQMSSDSSDEENPTVAAIPISQRPEWADVSPEHAPSLEVPVVAIDSPEIVQETMAYFRAVVAAKETSQRALALTEEVRHRELPFFLCWQAATTHGLG